MDSVVIVGRGIAGTTAAFDLRRYRPDARVFLVDPSPVPALNVPALKAYAAGGVGEDDLLAHGRDAEARRGVVVLRRRVEAVDYGAETVDLGDATLPYAALLLAPGAAPREWDAPGADAGGVFALHTLEDYRRLRRRLGETRAAAVVGGGFHAAETALLLAGLGVRATWYLRDDRLVPRHLDAAASGLLLDQVRRAGVDVRVGCVVRRVEPHLGEAAAVVCAGRDGRERLDECQLVVPCIGVAPATAPFGYPGGVPVDARLRAPDPLVWAAGAAALLRDPQTGRPEARGTWYAARQQGRLAAAVIGGAEVDAAAHHRALGAYWHATQVGRLAVAVVGAPLLDRERDDVEVLAARGPGWYRRLVLDHDVLAGYLAVGPGVRGTLALKRAIDLRVSARGDARRLLDPDFDVAGWLERKARGGAPSRVAKERDLDQTWIYRAAPSPKNWRPASAATPASRRARRSNGRSRSSG